MNIIVQKLEIQYLTFKIQLYGTFDKFAQQFRQHESSERVT